MYLTDTKAKNLYSACKFNIEDVFVFGSEGRGIRDLVKKTCDDIVSLPFKPNTKYKIDSLNVSNAASITLYEYYTKYY